MRCLRKFQWIKLFRDNLPEGKGILGFWAKLAACAAYRNGTSLYCGFENEVKAGSWVGGIVGIKSILGLLYRLLNFLNDRCSYFLTVNSRISLAHFDKVFDCSRMRSV